MKPTIIRTLLYLAFLLTTLSCNTPSVKMEKDRDNGIDTKYISAPEVEGYIKAFFKQYKETGSSDAIDLIFKTNPLFSDRDQLISLKSKIDSTRSVVGNFEGEELIVQKYTSKSLILYSYLAKHEIHPLRFTFIFYKPKDKWNLYKLKFDADVANELEESGKIYFIQ